MVMRKIVLPGVAMFLAILLCAGFLVACTPDDACAKPGDGSGSSGSRSSGGSSSGYKSGGSSYRSNTGGYKAPAGKHTTKSKPGIKFDDDLFEGDDENGSEGSGESC